MTRACDDPHADEGLHAYDALYLEKGKNALGQMLDYAVHDLGYEIEDFFERFIASGLARSFALGNPSLVVGRSGVELAWMTLELTEGAVPSTRPQYPADRSEEYWTGWALAWYQWARNLPFEDILHRVPIGVVRDLYYPYHEMDLRQFGDRMDELIGLPASPSGAE